MDKLTAFKNKLESDKKTLYFPNHLDFSNKGKNLACGLQLFQTFKCKKIFIPELSTVNEVKETFEFCGYTVQFLHHGRYIDFDGEKTIQEIFPKCDSEGPKFTLKLISAAVPKKSARATS